MKEILFINDILDEDDKLGQIYFEILENLDYKVHVISNEIVNKYNNYTKLEFTKRLFTLKNLKTYKILKQIIKQNDYEIIQCNSFISGVLTRLAGRKRNKNIIYSIDSFKFYKKQFFIKKIFYYLIEKFLSKFTNTIIVGNKEDYVIAKSKFYAKHVKTIKILNTKQNIEHKAKNKDNIKEKLGLKDNDYIFLNIGDLTKSENHIMQLEVMIELIKYYPQAKLIISGIGEQSEYLENIIEKYGLSKNVKIIENTIDIIDLLQISDCYLTTSNNKGNVDNLLKAMLEKKPIIATNIKEYRDLLKYKNLFEGNDIKTLKYKMIKNIEECKKIQTYYNLEKYKIEKVKNSIIKIYSNVK